MGMAKRPKKRPDLIDDSIPDTPHIEPKRAWSNRRVVIENGRKREEHERAQKRLVSEYESQRGLLANEATSTPKPDYSHIFDFKDTQTPYTPKPQNTPLNPPVNHPVIADNLRYWVRSALWNGMSIDQIKSVIISEFKLWSKK